MVRIRCEECEELRDGSSYLPGGVDYICEKCRVDREKKERRKNPIPDQVRKEESEVIFRQNDDHTYICFVDLPTTPDGEECFVLVDRRTGRSFSYDNVRARTNPCEDGLASELGQFLHEKSISFSVKKRATKKNRRRREEKAEDGFIVPVLPGASLDEADIIVGIEMKHGRERAAAVFPGVPGDEYGRTCFGYILDEGPTSFSYSLFKDSSEDPTKAQVDSIIDRLESLGYNVRVKTRTSERDERIRQERAYAWYGG